MVTSLSFLIIEDLGAHWSVDKVRSFMYILLTALPLPSIYKINKQKTQQIFDPVVLCKKIHYLVAIFPTLIS